MSPCEYITWYLYATYANSIRFLQRIGKQDSKQIVFQLKNHTKYIKLRNSNFQRIDIFYQINKQNETVTRFFILTGEIFCFQFKILFVLF